MSSIALEIHDMTVAYHRRPVLWDIDMQIPEGKLVGIVGPNGAGKTTLIKAALGLVPLASGKVEIYAKSYQQQRHLVGYVPQRESVDWDFPVTVRDVVLMGTYGHLGWFKRPGKKQYEIADRCLQQVGISQLSNRQIRQLSGGQQQRVFLARALAQNAQLYFLDEPFAGVDAATEAAIFELLQTLRSTNKTVLVVHHDLQTVRDYFDYVILLNMRLVAYGPTETTFTNENLQKTYGGRLTILDEAAEAMRQRASK
ncbi:MAG: metal ABC transporter ATP-binding protein [Pirellulales bacterium]|nr:metal ABC transporter ATP-binding protein [Pirellulales bacterium]